MVVLLERGLSAGRNPPFMPGNTSLPAAALIIDILTSFSEVANSNIWSVRPRITLLLVGFSVCNAKVRQSNHLTTCTQRPDASESHICSYYILFDVLLDLHVIIKEA